MLSDGNAGGFWGCCCGLVSHPPGLVEDVGPARWRPGARCSAGSERASHMLRLSRCPFFLVLCENLPSEVSSQCLVAGDTHPVSSGSWFSGTSTLVSHDASGLWCITSPANLQALGTETMSHHVALCTNIRLKSLFSVPAPCHVLWASKVQTLSVI